jgi:hypothetical protein
VWAWIFVVAVAVVAAVWLGNTLWWTKRNGNLGRRGTGIVAGETDELNRGREERRRE